MIRTQYRRGSLGGKREKEIRKVQVVFLAKARLAMEQTGSCKGVIVEHERLYGENATQIFIERCNLQHWLK